MTVQHDPDLGGNQEGAATAHRFSLSIPLLTEQAERVVRDMDLHISGCRVRKLVRRYVRDGRGDIDFTTWFLGYADPTGNEAVAHVMRAPR